jgi:2-amino-4-hydroxy-6-hydroxymethyldihydropteridine diphosphokinase
MSRVYIALGSNLNNPLSQLQMALDQLAGHEACHLLACSSVYQTSPWGTDQAQPDYLNAVACYDTTHTPTGLLSLLKSLEQAQGRVPGGLRNGPRCIDLDILLYGLAVIALPALTVPHPRLEERAFVLYPLAEIAPDLLLPTGRAVADLKAACDPQGIARVACLQTESMV